MRRILVSTAVLLAALTLAGCSAADSSRSSGGSASVGSADVATAPEAGSDASGGKSQLSIQDREIVTTGSVTVKATHPVKAADSAVEIVESAGGRIDSRVETVATKTEPGRATLTLRIPASALSDTLRQLKKLGAVQSTNLSSADVTQEGQDLDARITALRTSVTRLLALEAKATDTKVLIELESAISSRQGELDSLVAQRKLLSDQVAMSTVTLKLVAPADVPATAPTTPVDAFGAGVIGFGAFFTGVFLVLSYLAPWLLFGALVAIVIVRIVRYRRRRAPAVIAPPPTSFP